MSENSIDSFPEEAQEIIRSLREEAAKHRQAKKEAVAELDALKAQHEELVKVQEEYEQLLATNASLEEKHNKLNALLDADFSGPAAKELADLVKGEEAEEWVAHANKLSSLFAPAEKQEEKEAETPAYLDPSAGSAAPLNADPTIAKLSELFGD